jgi:acetyl-CoA acetyltransferase
LKRHEGLLCHPIGATGAIITVKALCELERIGGRCLAPAGVLLAGLAMRWLLIERHVLPG